MEAIKSGVDNYIGKPFAPKNCRPLLIKQKQELENNSLPLFQLWRVQYAEPCHFKFLYQFAI